MSGLRRRSARGAALAATLALLSLPALAAPAGAQSAAAPLVNRRPPYSIGVRLSRNAVRIGDSRGFGDLKLEQVRAQA